MKPAPFEYHRPADVDEAIEILAHHAGEAKVLAGGQSLVPMMNFRLATPDHLVDINAIDELAGVVERDGRLRLGAVTRHHELLSRPVIRRACPLLAQAAVFVGHPQIRSMGTLGGSLAHADPAAELPGVVAALDATIIARGPDGERRVTATEFFKSYFVTALDDTEIVTAVEVPIAGAAGERSGSAFLEVAARFGDFALAGTAVTVTVDSDDAITEARIACISVADRPLRMADAEVALKGQVPDERVLDGVASLVRDALDPTPSVKASADYKRRVAAALTARAVQQAWTRATEPKAEGEAS